jgi:hypothetical protein
MTEDAAHESDREELPLRGGDLPPSPTAGTTVAATLGLPPGFEAAAWAGALLGVLAALCGRAVAPALAGVWVGTDRLIATAELGAAALGQLFAIVAVALLMGLLVAVSRSSWPIGYRAFAVGVSGPVAMAVTSAMFIALPDLSGLVAGAAAAALAVLVGAYGLRRGRPRTLGLLLAGVGLGGLARMAAIGWLQLAEPGRHARWLVPAGALTSFVLDVGVVLLAVLWLVGCWPGMRRSAVGAGVAAAGLGAAAIGILALAVLGARPDASGAMVLANRALGQLMTNPGPPVANWLRGLVEVQAVVLAGAALFWPRTGRLLSAALVLALVGRGSLEAPLCALATVLAALLVSVAAPEPAARAADPRAG